MNFYSPPHKIKFCPNFQSDSNTKEETNPSSNTANKIIIDLQKEDEEDKELLNLITEPTNFRNDDDNNESLELSLQKYKEHKDDNKISSDKPIFNFIHKSNNKLLLPKINIGKMNSVERKISMSDNENESIKMSLPKGINGGNNIRYTIFNQLLNKNTKNKKSNFKTMNVSKENSNRINMRSIEILPSIK